MTKDDAVFEKYMKHVRMYFACVGILYAGAVFMNLVANDPIPKYLLLTGFVIYAVVAIGTHYSKKAKVKNNVTS